MSDFRLLAEWFPGFAVRKVAEGTPMRRHLLIGIILIILISLCGYPAIAQNVKGPKMVLKERVFDFKEVKEGEVIEHTFLVLNQGEEILEIKKVEPG